MSKIVICILLIFASFSCKKEVAKIETYPYLQFNNEAKEWLTKIKLYDIIELSDNIGNTRRYKVTDTLQSKTKVQECSSISGSCITYFEYDNLSIVFTRMDTIPIKSAVELYMWIPDSVYYKNVPQDVVPVAKMVGQFDDYNILPIAPSTKCFLNFPKLDSTYSITNFSNTTRMYTDVVILKSNNNSIYINPNNGSENSINEIWFDRKYGFVMLKDIYGKTWRRTN